MDRRYKESRFYNNVPVSNDGQEKAERLLQNYRSRFNAERKKAENYGGSTGGQKSLDPRFGRKVIGDRSSKMAEEKKVFDIEGRGEYGARKITGKDFTESRNYDWRPGDEDKEPWVRQGSSASVSVDSTGLGSTAPPRYTGNIFEDSDAFMKEDKDAKDAST